MDFLATLIDCKRVRKLTTQPIIVLGMHKSGTTLIARTLHESGVYMGDFSAGENYANCKYENTSAVEINKSLLRAEKLHSTATVGPLSSISKIEPKISSFVEEMNRIQVPWGVKDPRLCLTYDVWRRFLPPHKVIFIFRSPERVLEHYTRGSTKTRLNKMRKDGLAALRAWYLYNVHAYRIIQGLAAGAIVINFEEYLTKGQPHTALERFLRRSLSDARKERSRTSSPDLLTRLPVNIVSWLTKNNVTRLYSELAECSEGYL